MAMLVQKGTFAAPTVNGTDTVISLPADFDPKAIILWTTWDVTDNIYDAHAKMGIGWGTYRGSAVQQGYINYLSLDGQAAMDTARGANTTRILKNWSNANTTPAVDAECQLISMQGGATSQVVLDWIDAPASAYKIHYMVFGGSDLTDAMAGSYQITTAAGEQDITVATGFGKPDLIFTMSNPTTFSDNGNGPTAVRLGVGYDENNRRSGSFWANNGSINVEISSYQVARWFVSAGSAIEHELDLTAKTNWPTDGFQFTKVIAPSATRDQLFLAFKGPFSKKIGVETVGTSTGNKDTDLGFPGKGVILFGANLAPTSSLITADVADATVFGSWFMGGMDGTTEGSCGMADLDGDGTTSCGRYMSATKAIRIIHPVSVAIPVLQAEGDATFSGNNLRINYNDAHSVATEFIYVALGDAVAIPQKMRPRAGGMISATGWLDELSAAPTAGKINEAVRSDTTYLESPATPTAPTNNFEWLTDAANDPVAGEGTIKFAVRKNGAGSQNVNFKLMEGATTRATLASNVVLADTVTEFQYTLDQTTIDSVVDWGNVRVRVEPA